MFSHDAVVDRNKLYDNHGQHGCYFSNSSQRPVFTNNVSSGHKHCGVQINADRYYSENGAKGITYGAIIRGNKLVGNSIGINFDGVQDSLVEDNLIGDGLRIYHYDGGGTSSRNIIRGNTILGRTDRHAVVIRNNSKDNVFEHNVIRVPPSSTWPISQTGNEVAFTSRGNTFIGRGTKPIGIGQFGYDGLTLEEAGDIGSVTQAR